MFEFEGVHWQYAVVVIAGRQLKEVEMRAMTGKVTDSENMDPLADGKEFTADLERELT